jgi:zinc protease
MRMKSLPRFLLPVCLLLFVAGLLFSESGTALPALDPATITGTLDNGVRYYILKNAKPENRIEMRLVVQAGSLQEGPLESGLAHLIEHMQFEGTEHFGSQEIVNFLESNGMRFGGDLNATTGYQSTQYFLSLPADKSEVVAKGLSILEDWAHGPKVVPELLDKEKKIVAEEDRLRFKNAQGRAQDFAVDTIFAGSPYEGHKPIGDMSQVQAATPEILDRFVRRWYTPESMSIVIVGSLDPHAMEARLRSSFKRSFPDHGKPQAVPSLPTVAADSVDYFKDKELGNNVYFWWKSVDPKASSVEERARWELVSSIAVGSIRKRLDDLSRRPDTGIMGSDIQAVWSLGQSCELSYFLAPREGKAETAIAAYFAELKKTADFGITQSEFELGRKGWIDSNEAQLTQKENTTNATKASWIAGWIVDGAPMPFTDALYAYRKALAGQVSREDVNRVIAQYILPSPAKALVESIDKDGNEPLPAAALAEIKVKALAATAKPEPERVIKPLLAQEPTKGRIVKAEQVAGTPLSLWTLSNGMRVYFYKNSLTKNDFRFKAFAPGGRSCVSDADYENATLGLSLLNDNGAGQLNQSELQDFLTGKRAYVGFDLEEARTTIVGSSDAADPEDMSKCFQLLYAKLSDIRRDAEVEKASLANLREVLENNAKLPNFRYRALCLDLGTNGSSRAAVLKPERFAELDPDKVAAIEKSFFVGQAGMTFVISGDCDQAAIRKLVETYIASVPTDPETARSARDLGIRPTPGPVSRVLRAGGDDKAVVTIDIEQPYPYSFEAGSLAAILNEALNIRLREVLRQDNAGTYGVEARMEIENDLYQNASTYINFTCSPQNREALVKAMTDELAHIAGSGLSDDAYSKALEIRKRSIESGSKTNEYWLSEFSSCLERGDSLDKGVKLNAFLQKVKKADVDVLAARILDPSKAWIAILEPEK